MRLSHLFAAALIAGFAFTATAQAAKLPTTVTSETTGTYTIGTVPNDTYTNYTLAADTKLTINYTYAAGTKITTLKLSDSAWGSAGNAQATDTVTTSTNTPTHNASGTKVIVTANFVNDVATFVIENLSSTAITFDTALKGYTSKGATVTYYGAAVPLPPAAILFLSGLMAFAGFAMYKKVRNQA